MTLWGLGNSDRLAPATLLILSITSRGLVGVSTGSRFFIRVSHDVTRFWVARKSVLGSQHGSSSLQSEFGENPTLMERNGRNIFTLYFSHRRFVSTSPILIQYLPVTMAGDCFSLFLYQRFLPVSIGSAELVSIADCHSLVLIKIVLQGIL